MYYWRMWTFSSVHWSRNNLHIKFHKYQSFQKVFFYTLISMSMFVHCENEFDWWTWLGNLITTAINILDISIWWSLLLVFVFFSFSNSHPLTCFFFLLENWAPSKFAPNFHILSIDSEYVKWKVLWQKKKKSFTLVWTNGTNALCTNIFGCLICNSNH